LSERRCWAAIAIWSWRALSAATIFAISPLIEASSEFVSPIFDSIDALAAARCETTCC